jgi:enoyl-CoA hydratase
VDETRKLETVIYEKEGPIARIILNYPEKANTQSSRMVWDVEDCLTDADRDYDIKVVILKANGKGFSAGHAIGTDPDVNPEFAVSGAATGTTWKAQMDLFLWPVLHLWEFPKPTISAVHGYCLGGGTHYGLVTDMTIASDDAYFSYPVLQGFGMPSGECSIEPWIFMNWKRAAEYLYTGQRLTAQEALEFGLINRVVPRDELDETVESIARHIAQAPLTTLVATKANLKRAWELMGMRVHWQSSNDLVALASQSRDVQELIGQVFASGTKPAQMAAQRAEQARVGAAQG